MASEEQIKQILLNRIPGLSAVEITPEAELIRDLGADSLARLEILVDVEELFNVEIDDEEAEKLLTVGDVYACLKRKKDEDKNYA